MYFFWLMLMTAQPWLMLVGVFGLLGKDAERAAKDLATFAGILAILLIIALIIYSIADLIINALAFMSPTALI